MVKATSVYPKIQEITNCLVKRYQPEKVILFGSHASGDTSPWSDIDLVLIKDTPRKFYYRIGDALKTLREIDSKPPLDLLVYTPEEFENMRKSSYFIRDEVTTKGRVLYEK